MARVIIEVRGGVVVEAYSDGADTAITLVDWDDADTGPRERAARRFPHVDLSQLPKGTAELIKIANDA